MEEQAQRRAEMGRILDALEEEEAQEARVAVEIAKEKSRAFMLERKRESEQLAQASEQRRKRDKKMGKALLSAFGSPSPTNSSSVSVPKVETPKPAAKKSVKFEKHPEQSSQPAGTVRRKAEWGDVLAALPSTSSRRLMQNTPIKSDVVERFPASSSSRFSQTTASASQPKVDSDDEVGEVVQEELISESEPDEEEIETDGLDLVDALHQQEIASEYYTLRESVMNKSILAETIEASTFTDDPNSWDKEVGFLHLQFQGCLCSS
jgi:hypothetical protein